MILARRTPPSTFQYMDLFRVELLGKNDCLGISNFDSVFLISIEMFCNDYVIRFKRDSCRQFQIICMVIIDTKDIRGPQIMHLKCR